MVANLLQSCFSSDCCASMVSDCYQQDETTFHALWGCPKLKTARHSFVPLRDVQMSAAGSFMDFIHYCQVRIVSTNWRNFLSFCGATGFVEIVLFSIPLA
ncbi:hypothetical protein ACOSP7_014730 [Xanthoceras sorbifolium]